MIRLLSRLAPWGALCLALHAGEPVPLDGAQAVPAQAAPQVRAGDFEFECARHGASIRVFGFRPAKYDRGPVLVLFHGASRDAAGYRAGARTLAERAGMLLVVPEFDRVRFDVDAYQNGGVFKQGKIQPQDQWTFGWLKPLLAGVFRREGGKLPYVLAGHSAGAQFLGRLAAFEPNEARRMVLVNPGSLLFPSRAQQYPHGFGGLPEALAGDEALQRYLAAPLTLYLGTADVSRKSLATGKAAMIQGATRIARGRNGFEAGERLGASQGWPFAWRKVEAEGLAHPSGPMWAHPSCESAFAAEGL